MRPLLPTLLLVACVPKAPVAPVAPEPTGPTPALAASFIKENDAKLRELWVARETAAWNYETDIRPETEALASVASEASMAWLSEAIPKAATFDEVAGLDPDVARQLALLKVQATLPAPSDPELRKELAEITTKLGGMYGSGEWCADPDDPKSCADLGELERRLGHGTAEERLEAWKGWRTVSPEMRPLYTRFVELGNTGASEIGFADVGDGWRSGYDMSPAEFETEVDRLFEEVRPLYEKLHCHVRAKLAEEYGEAVDPTGPIPAHLLGNMWAQEWTNLYPMLEPYPGQPSLDVSRELEKQEYDPVKMVKTAEGFFTSMGLDPLPETFWERSMLTKPRDRDVVCHASAWDLSYDDDLRIKMCIRPSMEDLVTIHHELGHDYYFHAYHTRPMLYQTGANDGFHEAIGDAVALSITPSYLQQIGLLEDAADTDEAVINRQMMDALSKVAFLPFGRMIDQWRWDVFSGKIPADQYNQGWWELRQRYQGVAAPEPRGEEYFDPGAKYHIPGNTPYIRYFLANILQFQFHAAMCEAAGHTGPLHTCSVFGSEEAGKRLQATLELGASKPWPDALEQMTGTRQMSAEPLLEYFQPLENWLDEQNRDRQCGW